MRDFGKVVSRALLAAALLGALLVSGGCAGDGQRSAAPPAETPAQTEQIPLEQTPAPQKDQPILPSAEPTAAVQPQPSQPAPVQPDAEEKQPEQQPPPRVPAEEPEQQGAYLTDPIPEGKPAPVEPQDAQVTDTAHTCTISVRCDTLLNNMEQLDKDKTELVPADGVILQEIQVTFYEGESVFNVLQREMKRARLHLEFSNTPIYNSAYIEGIGNLYEFDCGELSGWMYRVNGWFPNYGSSRYRLQPGDVIEWVYTCDLGVDVGGEYAAGQQV